MPSSSSARSSSPTVSPQRQQWEMAVLTARLPAKGATYVVAALLCPAPNEPYAPRAWEPMQRFCPQAIRGGALERVRGLLRDELRQAHRLVWTPLADFCLLKRNVPLAVHAARLAQLAWELERRSRNWFAEEVQRYTRGKGSA